MKSQRGASQLELILYTGVVMVLSVAVIAMFIRGHNLKQNHEIAAGAMALVHGIEKGFGIRQSYYGLTASSILDKIDIPNALDGKTTLATVWGDVELSSTGAMHNTLELTFHGVPSGQCARFATALAKHMDWIDVGTLRVAQAAQVDRPLLVSACGQSSRVSMQRMSVGYGNKAVWETW